MLKNKSRFLPTRSVPALMGFLVLMACNAASQKGCDPNFKFGIGLVVAMTADRSTKQPVLTDFDYHPESGSFVQTPSSQTLPLITPVDQTTLNPPRAGSVNSQAVRAAFSTTSSTVVYILDEFGSLLQFDPSSSTVVATLNFSQVISQGIATRFAVTLDRHFAFITVNSAQTAMSTGYVLVADLTSFSIVSTIPLPAGTVVGGIAITPDGSLAYVVTQPYSGSGPSNVYVIDTAKRTITMTIPVAGYSNLGQIAITPDGTEAYLVDSLDTSGFSIPVLDLQSNTVEPPISISGRNLQDIIGPSYIALHPDGTRLYFLPLTGGPVYIVSTITKTRTGTIPLAPGAGPVYGAQPTFTADGIHLAFMSGMNLMVFVNTLTDTVESSITLPPPPFEPIRNISFFFVPKP